MAFNSITASDAALEERIKKDLKGVENELERLAREKERLEADKQKLMKQLGELHKKRDEGDLLAMVYQQRRGGRK